MMGSHIFYSLERKKFKKKKKKKIIPTKNLQNTKHTNLGYKHDDMMLYQYN